MPELPDVEGFRRVLAAHAVGPTIKDVRVLDAGVLRNTTAPAMRRAVVGRAFGTPDRRGKWLIAPLRRPRAKHRGDDPSVVFHFGMTGRLTWSRGDKPERDDRLVLETRAGNLTYGDLRKLHGIRLVPDDNALSELLEKIGPDAATLGTAELRTIVRAGRRQLKPLLMDQSVVAGLGNLLVDEILWRARLHPTFQANELSDNDIARLHRQLRRVLRDSIEVGRVPGRPTWLSGARDEPDAPCPRCGTRLNRRRIGGRTTVWCPDCQQVDA
jgi:formamidopyrimidine-DNA glycosylase